MIYLRVAFIVIITFLFVVSKAEAQPCYTDPGTVLCTNKADLDDMVSMSKQNDHEGMANYLVRGKCILISEKTKCTQLSGIDFNYDNIRVTYKGSVYKGWVVHTQIRTK
jgi:hypothetical protein